MKHKLGIIVGLLAVTGLTVGAFYSRRGDIPPEVTTVARGAMVAIRLRIKNTGKRTCNRDVGADQQELYIKKGAAKVWSSDTCGNVKGSDVQPFTPNFEREYRVDWNGKDVSKCADNLANGPVPAAGDYQVFGRLATKTSNPVKLTLR